jgi:Ca-activated chloride channel family protein
MRSSLVLAVVIGAVSTTAGMANASELPRTIGLHPAHGPSLALLDSKIEVTVRGPIIEAVVTQRFQNRSDHATEATYVFPLPVDAAVSAMAIKMGSRTIRASIEKRDDAQRRYEAAVRAGVAAALLDQERPDVFTQTVAAIPARGSVDITLRFDTTARFTDGVWELVLPLVVAPRYVPGAATNRPTTGTGRAPDTDRAPDASRVTPAGAPGAGGSTQVVIRFVDKPSVVTSPTHELRVAGSEATFSDPKTDHDAVVRWKAAASAAGWVEQSADGGYAAVVVEAPAVAPRKGSMRCMLVLDRSATSRGDADAVARPLVRSLLGSLTASDRVAVAGSDQLAWAPPADISRVLEQAWSSPAGAFDLTRVLASIRAEGAPIVLVSSGLVADDRAAVVAAAKLGVPIHIIGVGPAPARGVLVQLAAVSGGTVRFAIPGDDLGALAKAALADAASQPAPLTVTWGTLAANEVVPGTLPRLGAGQASLVLARVKRAQTANARARGELFAIETLPAGRRVDGATTAMGPLARRWARNRLDELLAARASANVVTAHALRYGLVSPYTSMVAVGDEVVVQGGVKRSVAIPVSVPAGMRWQQVKKETTVATNVRDGDALGDKIVTKTEPKRPVAKPDPSPAKPKDNIAARKVREKEKREPIKTPAPTTPSGGRTTTGSTQSAAPPPAPEPESKPSADDFSRISPTDSAGRDHEDDEDARDMPKRTATLDSSPGSASEGVLVTSTGTSRRWRFATSFGGGLLRTEGANASLLALGTRLELRAGRRVMAGFDGALWLVDGDDVAGHALVSIAWLPTGGAWVMRRLEIGVGAGLHFGDGAGPAGALSLRYHVPAQPRAAGYLRYDGALILRDDTRRGQSTFTLGVEWGF